MATFANVNMSHVAFACAARHKIVKAKSNMFLGCVQQPYEVRIVMVMPYCSHSEF